MTTFEHVLQGCAPVPLAGYLKALGIFRLVAEQADADVRGFWRDERFVLKTRLVEDELVRFFVETYEPSPIVSPWNGRAGFLEGIDEDAEGESSRKGAELVRLYESAADRFGRLREAVRAYRGSELVGELDRSRAEAKPLQERKRKKDRLSEEESGRLKALEAFIKRCRASAIVDLRSQAPDSAIAWFDACQRITQERTVSPLLGAGGLDGSRDFGVNFGVALGELFDLRTGYPLENTAARIRASMGLGSVAFLDVGNLGLYQPGGAGENISTGFRGEQPFNPANLVLLFEGIVLFSGVTTRRLGSTETRLSFPFTVSALTAGTGAAASADDQSFAEFWAPIWTRPAQLDELSALLAEGRTVIGGRTANDGLEFAVAVSTLGSQRGVEEYQRFALLQREPRNPKKATPLGRVRARDNPRASLVSELEAGGWLSRARTALHGKSVPPSLVAIGRSLDEALFRVATDGSANAIQEALVVFGALMLEVGRRRKLHEVIPLPPRLSSEWPEHADDGSHEFTLAASVVSLDAQERTENDPTRFRFPFRRHLVAVGWDKGREVWSDSTEAAVLRVWTGRDLLRDLGDVLERRLIEAERRTFLDWAKQPELPLGGSRMVSLDAIAGFLAGNTDDQRIAALATGLAWANLGRSGKSTREDGDSLPFAYQALKPLFGPEGVGATAEQKKLLNPIVIARLLRAGRVREAINRGQRIARGAGLSTPFAQFDVASALDPARLMAALLFPIAQAANKTLIERAYPDLTNEKENDRVP